MMKKTESYTRMTSMISIAALSLFVSEYCPTKVQAVLLVSSAEADAEKWVDLGRCCEEGEEPEEPEAPKTRKRVRTFFDEKVTTGDGTEDPYVMGEGWTLGGEDITTNDDKKYYDGDVSDRVDWHTDKTPEAYNSEKWRNAQVETSTLA